MPVLRKANLPIPRTASRSGRTALLRRLQRPLSCSAAPNWKPSHLVGPPERGYSRSHDDMQLRGLEGSANGSELTTPPPTAREKSPRFSAAPKVPIQGAATGTLRRRYCTVRPAPESARNATRRTTRHLQDLVPQLAGHLDFSCKMLTFSDE